MKYDFKETEEKIRKFWEKEKIYGFDPKKKGKIYSIDTPPPTVSGDMHIGHAFSYSQQDFIARFQRMFLSEKGQVFYPFGTDDNGLPTERLVEKLKKIKSKDMSRDEFIKLCLKTLKEITPKFVQDWKNVGISSDFDIFYSTIDENSRKLSQESFLELYEKGHVYKDKFPTIWCPECQTSIAQAELEDKEKPSVFSDIKFNISGGGKEVVIATTRPELIPACVAIFVHPEDKRYKGLIGKEAKVPLFDYSVPVIGDRSADPEKGTGAMMVCSYGDKYDVESIMKHKLTPRIIFNKDGTVNGSVEKYKGLKIKDARKEILNDLKEEDLIVKQEQISHTVNVHDKCGTPIEFIPTEQWFVKLLDKKKKLISQGKKINWYPKFMRKRYENWVEGLEWDWNISRDRHFGVPIPVWYCETCEEVIVADKKDLPVDPTETKKECKKCKKRAIGEKKVLDTWATSSLTPQIASSLVKDKIKIPYSLRPQAHDIIRTWAFYTIVKSYLHENEIPWKDIVISGFVTMKGEKMSKSKGNTITPQNIIDEYGADALRFWAAGSKLGEDLDYQEKDLVTGKKTVIKLFNASKFVFMNLEDYDPNKKVKPDKLVETDRIFLKELNLKIKEVTGYFSNYEYSRAKLEMEKFFWGDFADNYIEIVKKRVYQGSGDDKLSAQYTLYKSLLTILKLFAPIMPFVTEEIYQTYFRKFEKDKSIHLSEWPESELDKKMASHVWPLYIDVISRIRKEKSEAKKSMNSEIILTLENKSFLGKRVFWKISKERFAGMIEDLKNVTNAREIKEGKFNVEFVEDKE